MLENISITYALDACVSGATEAPIERQQKHEKVENPRRATNMFHSIRSNIISGRSAICSCAASNRSRQQNVYGISNDRLLVMPLIFRICHIVSMLLLLWCAIFSSLPAHSWLRSSNDLTVHFSLESCTRSVHELLFCFISHFLLVFVFVCFARFDELK